MIPDLNNFQFLIFPYQNIILKTKEAAYRQPLRKIKIIKANYFFFPPFLPSSFLSAFFAFA